MGEDSGTAIVLRRESTTIACPFGDRRPVPRRTATDGPFGLGQQVAVSPDVGGLALHAESFGDLDDAYGVAVVHGDNCSERLDNCLRCSDNNYMNATTSQKLSEAASKIEAHDLHAARVILSFVSINDVCDTAEGIGRLRTLDRLSRGHA